jgi:hypothetical protein
VVGGWGDYAVWDGFLRLVLGFSSLTYRLAALLDRLLPLDLDQWNRASLNLEPVTHLRPARRSGSFKSGTIPRSIRTPTIAPELPFVLPKVDIAAQPKSPPAGWVTTMPQQASGVFDHAVHLQHTNANRVYGPPDPGIPPSGWVVRFSRSVGSCATTTHSGFPQRNPERRVTRRHNQNNHARVESHGWLALKRKSKPWRFPHTGCCVRKCQDHKGS